MIVRSYRQLLTEPQFDFLCLDWNSISFANVTGQFINIWRYYTMSELHHHRTIHIHKCHRRTSSMHAKSTLLSVQQLGYVQAILSAAQKHHICFQPHLVMWAIAPISNTRISRSHQRSKLITSHEQNRSRRRSYKVMPLSICNIERAVGA